MSILKIVSFLNILNILSIVNILSFEQHGRFEHREYFEQEQENSTKLLSFVYRGIVGILKNCDHVKYLAF